MSLTKDDIQQVADAVSRQIVHAPCSAFTPGEIETLKAFIARLDAAGKTAWVTFVGAVVIFLLGALAYGVRIKLMGIGK